MKKYKYILWDIDDTLIDFKSSEKIALKKCFEDYGVILTDEDVEVYSNINSRYWDLLTQGKIDKKVMLNKRFEDFTEQLNLEYIDCEAINRNYQEELGGCAIMYDGAYEICKEFQKTKKLYAVTNGTAVAQHKKLNKTGLVDLFDGIFISDEVGYEKPDIRFFDYVFNEIPNFKAEETIIIGDSLLSDMMGANNSGIDCCWFNPKGNINGNTNIKINFEIKMLNDLLEIIE